MLGYRELLSQFLFSSRIYYFYILLMSKEATEMAAGREREGGKRAFFLHRRLHFHSSPGTRASLLDFSPCVWRMLFDVDSPVCFCPWPRCA